MTSTPRLITQLRSASSVRGYRAQVVCAIELQGLTKMLTADRLTLGARLFDEAGVARVQRAHRGHQADGGPGVAERRRAGRAGRQSTR